MASWIDIFALIATLSVVGGVIYGVIYVSNQISKGVASTKENLKSKGLTISQKGVSVKTSKRFDRADYVDATQRGFVKALGASTYGSSDNVSTVQSPGKMNRQESSTSVKSSTSGEEKKKMSSMFRRNNNSGSKEKI
ncbi:hypothetical protein FPV67DRAFT_1632907 [Lyophyllum atratum]|nr:hypothetical protein FPV67DRAFT_1632907 [Lyophyllum atratum]